MIRTSHLVLRSLWYYRRINLALALGVAAATAVLTGAIMVGDSMRGSLRQLAIQRLGKLDDLIVSEGFFSTRFVKDLKSLATFQSSYRDAEPAIYFPGGSVERTEAQFQKAGGVTVLGIERSFWSFADPALEPLPELDANSAIINQALADRLGISPMDVESGSARITVRIPKQHQLPADSAMASQDDLVESLVDLSVVGIVPSDGLGGFGLYPSQVDPLNVFLSITRLQESLQQTVLRHKSDPQQANLVLLIGKDGAPPKGVGDQLLRRARPTLDDLGISLKRISQKLVSLNDSAVANPSQASSATVFDYASLTTDRLVFGDRASELIQRNWPAAKPVFTYLSNELRVVNPSEGDGDRKQSIPFSMVTAIDFDESFNPQSSISGGPIAPLAADEIVLVEWAAADLGAKVGDLLELRYFEPETTHGEQVEQTVVLKLVDIAKLTKPETGYITRRGSVQPAQFFQRPEITNDPDLTPEVPGLTDAESIDRWDLPFETASRIRPQDDQYWNDYRTTPKAYVALALGQRLWNSRFGKVTSFRLPANYVQRDGELASAAIESAENFGLQAVSIKRRGLEASAGSTPFDILFLALSMFVIASALILMVLLFRLNVQYRASEIGILSAIGWSGSSILKAWLTEMSLVSIVGAVLGVILGIGYAALMIWGLTTWWVDAISTPFLRLHLNPYSLLTGGISGWLFCTLTIGWSLQRALKLDTRVLLAGQLEPSSGPVSASVNVGPRDRMRLLAAVSLLIGISLSLIAIRLSGEAQAGAFMGAGFFVLVAAMSSVYRSIRRNALGREAGAIKRNKPQAGALSLLRLASLNGPRHPLRSTLTIGLVAIASFLIAAVSSFRMSPTEQGTGGFDWVAKSSQPILLDLSSSESRSKILDTDGQPESRLQVFPLRLRSGEDASCNNLYQSTRPQVLGLPQRFIDQFDWGDETTPRFGWAGSLAQSEGEQRNPLRLLSSMEPHRGSKKDPIPTVIDKNTANYSLKIYRLNSIFVVHNDHGEALHFQVVGFLANTILQGSLLIGERDFLTAYPEAGGYQYFLIRQTDASGDVEARAAGVDLPKSQSKPAEIVELESRLGDYGFEASSASQLLANFLKVQNTYLSTFQTLGSLGLLLGTFGLAVIQLRAIIERRREFGLLRAVGFSESQLGQLILLENLWLLGKGLGVGLGAALFATLPHRWLGNATIPWLELALMFGLIATVGLLASGLAAVKLGRVPVLESLRN